MVTIDSLEIQQLKGIAISLVIALIANCLFYVFGFYTFPKRKEGKEERLPALLILTTLIIFLLSPLIIIPSITSLWFVFNGWNLPENLPVYTETWLHLIGIWLTFTLFMAFIFLLDSSTRSVVFGPSRALLINLGLGGATWFAAYPTVLFVGNSLTYGIYKILGKEVGVQVVIEKLKLSMQHPTQYQIMLLSIIVVIPFLEELFFRGFLQTWIRQYAGRTAAIVLASMIFSFFHFSSLQGVTNIQLIFTLFVLSCYLGYLRERQNSIWAPFALHAAFNGMSILILHVIPK